MPLGTSDGALVATMYERRHEPGLNVRPERGLRKPLLRAGHPPFGGYASGHSAYSRATSRAAAEALTAFTGDACYRGQSSFPIVRNAFVLADRHFRGTVD